MGVPTSEIGYTSTMPRREDHEVHKDMWGHWGGGGGAFEYVEINPTDLNTSVTDVNMNITHRE